MYLTAVSARTTAGATWKAGVRFCFGPVGKGGRRVQEQPPVTPQVSMLWPPRGRQEWRCPSLPPMLVGWRKAGVDFPAYLEDHGAGAFTPLQPPSLRNACVQAYASSQASPPLYFMSRAVQGNQQLMSWRPGFNLGELVARNDSFPDTETTFR